MTRTMINAVMMLSASSMFAQPLPPNPPSPPQQAEVQIRRMAPGGSGLEIGVTVRDMEQADTDRQKVTGGAVIQDVRAGSPAEKAGLQRDDVITRIGDMPINDLQAMTDALRAHKPGDVVPVTVQRDGKPLTVTVTLGARS